MDGCLGFTGGINIGDEWLPKSQGGQGFRDDMVRLRGPAVAGLTACFRRTWRREGAPNLRRFFLAPESAGKHQARVLGQAGHRNRREIVDAYLANIYGARHRVWISNSYFVPDRSILRALRVAALRGVDVRILLPGQSDVEIVRLAGRATYTRLLRAGVRIFELQGNILHSKTAVVDSLWSTIGTYNMDHISLAENLEVNVAVLSSDFAGVMERSFLKDLERAREVNSAEHRARPRLGRSLERAAYRLRKFL